MNAQVDPRAALRRAEERHAEAVAAERRARAEVADELRRGERRRSRAVWGSIVVGAVLIAGLLVAALVIAVTAPGDGGARQRERVLAAAEEAITVMLSADPARAGDYVPAVLEVTTGAQRDRVLAADAELTAVVAGLPAPGSGTVISAGLVSDPPDDPVDGDGAEVLLVVRASDPILVGAADADPQATLRAGLAFADGTWRLAETEVVA